MKYLPSIHDILQSLNSPLDIFLISETKLQEEPDPDLSPVQIPGYKFIPTYSTLSFGGTGIYLLLGLDHTVRYDLNFINCDGCEATFIEIPTPGKQKDIMIGAIYRHPHNNHESFYGEFARFIEKTSSKFHLILMGDINIDVSPQVKNVQKTDYKNLLFSLGIKNMISKPTRITKTTETIIDHILTNLPNEIMDAGILMAKVADHLPTYALCGLSSSKQKTSNLFQRSITEAKKEQFRNTFKEEVASFHLDDVVDPDLYLNHLVNAVKNSVDSVFPIKKRSKKHFKRFRKPWMTQGILNSVRKKHILYAKFLKSKDDAAYKIYTTHNNRLTRVKEQARDCHFQNDFNETSGDSKMTWKKLNKLLNKPKSSSKLPKCLIKENGELINEPKLIANKLNRYFTEKGTKLASKLPQPANSIYTYM